MIAVLDGTAARARKLSMGGMIVQTLASNIRNACCR
jgi:hypothetical protein